MSATADPNAITAAAVSYAEMGYRVIPLHSQKNGFCHCSKGGKCPSAGKHPVDKNWQDQDITFHPERFKRRNVGIATGPASGLLVVDVDTDEGKGGKASITALQREHERLPRTYVVQTGGGGWQLYFRYTGDDIGNSAGKLGPGLDTRGKGGYVVAPPSVSGKGPYSVFRDEPVADAPEWLLELLRPKVRETSAPTERTESHGDERLEAYEQAIIDQELARLKELADKTVGPGETYTGPPWDQTTFEVACNLFELANAEWSNLNEATVEHEVYHSSPPFDDDGWDPQRVLAKIDSAKQTVGTNATPLPEDRPSENETLAAMAGETYTPDEPATESAVKPRAEVPPPEVAAFTENPLIPLPAEPGGFQKLEQWLETSLVAGSRDLFWEVVGAAVAGDASQPAQVAIKGAPTLTAALTRSLSGTPGGSEGVIHVDGVGFSTIETDDTDIVLEFDTDLDVTAETLAAVHEQAVNKHLAAQQRGAYSSADEEVASRDAGDYRITGVLRSHIGQRRSTRGDADEFNMGG